MHVHHVNHSRGTESFLRKLRVASNERAYSKFHQKLARHLQGMQMSLGVLGWYDRLVGRTDWLTKTIQLLQCTHSRTGRRNR